jgi:hypothetical protein
MPFVNFREKFRFFSFDFRQISMFEHFRGDWAYAEPNFFDELPIKIFFQIEERISAHAQPAVKCEQFLHVQYMLSIRGTNFIAHWAYAERIFHRMLSIRWTDFIACWACAEMFKSQISWPNRIWFSKISCYTPLGPYGFGFCKKSIKKNFMLVYL